MSGLHEVDCSGCGRRHMTDGEQARKLRVLRCDCGHFVRLDRAFAERRSEPRPPPPIEIVNARAEGDEDADDATHMFSSLAEVAAMSGSVRSRSPLSSLVDDERVSRPTQRDGALRQAPSVPAPARQRQQSIAPTDKPLWYVDLGGTEMVQMTIEQLILARRSGKLGEGALVWREGMPGWRPVGTLIPAASASSHPGPLPSSAPTPNRPSAPAAARTPVPGRPPPPKRTSAPSPALEEATPQSLASYERPLATLEFALERPAAQPLLAATRSPFPSIDSSAHPLSRPPTPLPRASLSSAFSTPFPRAAQLPRLTALATPMPTASPRPSPPPPPAPVVVAAPSPLPAAPAARTSDRPYQPTQATLQTGGSTSERPRWVSAGIALIVCVTASAAGATLVRSLKQHPKPQALPVSAVSTAPLNATATKPPLEAAHAAPSSAPLVVALESLTVEHKHAQPHAVRAVRKPAPTLTAEGSEDAPAPANESAPEPSAQETPTNSDLPAAARSNPYGSGSLIDQIKKATADEEAGQ